MKKIIWLFSLSLLLSCGTVHQAKITDKHAQQLEKEIGQMILVGFRGKTVPDYLKEDLKSDHIGGVILFDYDVVKKEFDRNIESPEQVKRLTAELKQYARTPIFIAIDQEGGVINRLKPEYGFPKTKSAQTLGLENDTIETYKNAQVIANTLSQMGINLNFAPVVDLNINPNNPAIGKKERSYSADPKIVVNHARMVIKAHTEKNILTAIKHFPGHGSGWNDSHEGFVDLTETWSKEEIIPYTELINEKVVPMVMTAHIFNKNLDAELPGTLSPKVIKGILRDQMKFNGVIISDDLQMGAIKDHFSLEETVVKLVNAGADIFLIGNNLDYDPEIDEKIRDIVLAKIADGEITEKQIHSSYKRIMALKTQYEIVK